ncbi:MAG TPA: ECF transporter S component, partial [Clostridia bacterium]|nr:ECF transporter S component [Clostridia bacterium]
MKKHSTKELTLLALLIAIVFVSTYLVQIPMPFSRGGLIHVGDVAFMCIALLFGARMGAIAGGVGMALFDILSPYAIWAPFTLVIRLLMGWLIGTISHGKKSYGRNTPRNILALLASLPLLIGGYYVAEAILYGNWIAPLQSVSGNLGQYIVGFIGSLALNRILGSLATVKKYQKESEK